MGRFERLVAACMHHCPYGDFCVNFWMFFKEKDLTPVAYYNHDGVGEAVMRRIVFDCDRCGRKDVAPVYSRYSAKGETDEHLLEPESLKKQLMEHGFDREVLTEAVFTIVALTQAQMDWKHFCDKCFGRLCTGIAQFMKVRRISPEQLSDEQGDEDEYDEDDELLNDDDDDEEEEIEEESPAPGAPEEQVANPEPSNGANRKADAAPSKPVEPKKPESTSEVKSTTKTKSKIKAKDEAKPEPSPKAKSTGRRKTKAAPKSATAGD